MKLFRFKYEFKGGEYGGDFFVVAETPEKALEAVITKVSNNPEADEWDRRWLVPGLTVANLPENYSLDMHEPGTAVEVYA